MSKNTSTVLHFSRAAAVYHTRAELQRAVAGKLLEYLSSPVEAERVLELGCGTGFLTASLLELLARCANRCHRHLGRHDRAGPADGCSQRHAFTGTSVMSGITRPGRCMI